jgi:hypothetical protein
LAVSEKSDDPRRALLAACFMVLGIKIKAASAIKRLTVEKREAITPAPA